MGKLFTLVMVLCVCPSVAFGEDGDISMPTQLTCGFFRGTQFMRDEISPVVYREGGVGIGLHNLTGSLPIIMVGTWTGTRLKAEIFHGVLNIHEYHRYGVNTLVIPLDTLPDSPEGRLTWRAVYSRVDFIPSTGEVVASQHYGRCVETAED